MSFPVLLFDLDGTLVDTSHDLAAAINAVMRAEGHNEISVERLGHLFGQGGRAMLRRALADSGVSEPTPETIERLNRDFIAFYRADIATLSRPFPGAVDALDTLRDAGWQMAVCTNKTEVVARELLVELGLIDRFRTVVGADTFARPKPDAMPLLGAIGQSGGRVEGSVMIGDSRTDIDAARAAGLPVVAVTFGYTDTPVSELGPDVVIDHFDQLAEALAGLAGG
ncbi:HAD family hydrolase [Stappia sp.]|uniref:HAD family hydrolase n=1 Tax=Stappia sp. TaxID=1870903 RepID=UPI003D152930